MQEKKAIKISREKSNIRFKYLWDIADFLERLTANALVATFLGSMISIPASSERVESEGRQMKQCVE